MRKTTPPAVPPALRADSVLHTVLVDREHYDNPPEQILRHLVAKYLAPYGVHLEIVPGSLPMRSIRVSFDWSTPAECLDWLTRKYGCCWELEVIEETFVLPAPRVATGPAARAAGLTPLHTIEHVVVDRIVHVRQLDTGKLDPMLRSAYHRLWVAQDQAESAVERMAHVTGTRSWWQRLRDTAAGSPGAPHDDDSDHDPNAPRFR